MKFSDSVAMSFVKFLSKSRFLPKSKALEIFPPFFFMGVKVIKATADYRHLHVRLPLKWYGKNMHGTMFGGFICAVSDPLPALLCAHIFPNLDVWTKKNSVEFLKPARERLDLKIDITDLQIQIIEGELRNYRQSTHTFEFQLTDTRNRAIARVENTVFMRQKLNSGGSTNV